ncbi:MAG: GNAT family N-acetyltransferase [ANME-2 cluster archaeon]|nr:GNAT family N-acetyltransferase [ANME-2 cluster archaeon]
MEIKEANAYDFEKLRIFMELVDDDFFPPLSLRPGGIHGRISGCLAGTDSNYLIAEDESILIAALGYHKNWDGTGEAYISFLAVHPDYRGQDIARSLDSVLIQKLEVTAISYINVTTWSTNPGGYEMYKRLGYRFTRTLKDHRAAGVDTLCLKKKIGHGV